MSNFPDPSANNTNLLTTQQNPHSSQQQQQMQTSSNNNAGQITIDFNHQTFQTWLDILVDSSKTEDIKLKTIQDLSFNWELMQTLPSYPQLVEDAMHKFMRLLRETEPQFINESTVQQLRKKVLDIIYRTTPVVANNITITSGMGNLDSRTALIRDVLLVVYQLLERDNEDNVMACLKIIVEYHRHLKTTSILTNEVQQLFSFVKNIYRSLPQNMNIIFNYKPIVKVADLNGLNLEQFLSETYSSFQIMSEPNQTLNVLPRGSMSLKVLAECPINTVMMYQMYKAYLTQEVAEMITLIANIIALQPTEEQRLSIDLKEVNADFVSAQVKALSFIAYFKTHKEILMNNSDLVVTGILQLLKNCPPELVSVRKDLLAISRHIISDLRQKFLPYITQFFDETTFCSTGYTASESLRPNASSIVADLIHNVRKQLSYPELCKAITYFSKSLHDPLLYINLQHMCCRVLLSLIECVKCKDQENVNARDFILKLLEVFVLKFKSIAKYQVAYLLENNNSNTNTANSTVTNNSNSTSIASTSNSISVPTTSTATTVNDVANSDLTEKKTKIDKLENFLNTFENKERIKIKYGPSSVIIQNELDCKTTIKFLIIACRSITSVIIDTTLSANEKSLTMQPKQLTSRETIVFIKLLKNALLSLDIYMIGRAPSQTNTASHTVKNTTITQPVVNTAASIANQKEEKEVIENLGCIFAYLHTQTLKEIFTQTIDFIIERTFKNANISILSSYFLATPATSCTFATILIEYLLKKMEFMGDSSSERSNLYLKLFKLVFGSVSVFPAENEKMLKPHLHTLVTKSLELALKAKEPYNYFLLLRALFRSIGGGNHDLLYQEFLPLLPVLLRNLNELQTGLHKQYLKDLFVELCLTVPVRLSSLLPYLPMLMDPLVSALNGSQTLVSQGLRTLELCVENLQPDFLYDNIQPVRTDLIHGLWNTLRSPNETIAQAAFRVLGKLGGSNRKMIVEPQKLKYNTNKNNCKEFNGPTIKVPFANYQASIEVSFEKVIESCQNILKNPKYEIFYKKHAFKIVASFLVSLIQCDNDQSEVLNLFKNFNPTSSNTFTQHLLKNHKFNDEHLRKMVDSALTSIFYASNIKEIKHQVVSILDSFVIHLTLISLAHYNNQDENKIANLQQSNVFYLAQPVQSVRKMSTSSNTTIKSQLDNIAQQQLLQQQQQQQSDLQKKNSFLDFFILVDSLFNVLCNDDIEYWPIAQRSILIVIETSEIFSSETSYNCRQKEVGVKEIEHNMRPNLINLALFDYLAEKMCHLCYERSWYAKKAGCQLIRLLCKRMPFIWVLNNFYLFLRSIMFILGAASGEISSGAIDVAQDSLEELVKLCGSKLKPPINNISDMQLNEENEIYNKLVEIQQKSLSEVIIELIRQMNGDAQNFFLFFNKITSSNIYIRKNSIKLLRLIAELQNKSVYLLIQPYNEVLNEIVPLRKHLKLRHFSAQAQIGILEGLEFCSSTQPQLFGLNLSNEDHKNLFQELLQICEGDESQLSKNVCYKNENDLTPLKKSALNTLASLYHLLGQRETILSNLHRALASVNTEIQQVAFNCLKKFITNTEAYSASLRNAQNAQIANNLIPPQPNPLLENLRPTMQIAADYLKDYLHPLTEYTSLNLNVMQHLSYITQLYPTILNEKFSEYILSHLKRWLDDISEIAKENANTIAQATEGAQINNQNISINNLPLKSYTKELKLCAAIVSLLAELQSAGAKLVDSAILILIKYERVFMLEVNGLFRAPLSNFLKRYPFETLKYLLHSDRIKDMYLYRFVLYLIKTQPGFTQIFKTDPHRLIQMLNESQTLLSNAHQLINATPQTPSSGITTNPNDLIAKSNQIQYLTILIIYRLVKHDKENEWIVNQSQLIEFLLKIWCDERFHEKHKSIDQLDYIYWKETIYLIKIFLKFHTAQLNLQSNQNQLTTNSGQQIPTLYPVASNVELLFKLLIVFQYKSLLQYEFLRLFFKDVVAKTYTCEWKRAAFFTFVKIFTTPNSAIELTASPSFTILHSQKLKANILQYIIIPCFQYCFENNQHAQLIGGPPQPEVDNDENVISVFINKVVDPDNQYATSDSVRIFLLQLSSLFVQYAHDYIHDANYKKQGTKLRRLMTFAWPCLLNKTCVDPFNKYHGHLLLSHIISKFAINKRIVLQVFHSLLKAYPPEAKIVVRQALEILSSSFPARMEDSYYTLATWTKKILIEDNNTIPQLAHMLYIIVKYHKVYYLIRHTLINHLLTSFQKVYLSPSSSPENRQLAIDLTEVILRWEAQCVRETKLCQYNSQLNQQNLTDVNLLNEQQQIKALLVKHPEMLKPFDKAVSDCIINFFIRISCPITDQQQQQQQQPHINQNETLAKRCLSLFQIAVSNDIWPNADIKLDVLDKIMYSLETVNVNFLNGTSTTNQSPQGSVHGAQQQHPNQSNPQQQTAQPNYSSICTVIEMIVFLVENSAGSRTKIQNIFRSIQRGMTACLICTNSNVVRGMSQLIQKIMTVLPIECFNNNPNVAPSAATNLTSTGLNSPGLINNGLGSSNDQTQPQFDPIYHLFGQPEGILCRTIIEGLSNYEKSSSIAPNISDPTYNPNTNLNISIETLTNCLLLLKSASANNPQYIDRIMGPFMRILQKLYRDHLNATGVLLNSTNTFSSQIGANSTSLEGSNFMIGPNSTSFNSFSELLIQSLDLIKYRIGVMSIEMRKMFINIILVNLIDKSIDLRLIRYLNKIISDWIKYKNGPLMNQIPSLKEKLVLLQRLAIAMEKRFVDHSDLQQSFLETIAYVYKDDVYSANHEFKIKLEQAFLCGLKCSNPQIRQLFFEIFNTNFSCTDLYERLCYIVVTQNWESFGVHYWIKQCIQMTLGSCAKSDVNIVYSDLAASKFYFNSLTNASSISHSQFSFANDLNQSFTTKTEPVVSSSSETSQSNENVVLNVDTNLGESFWPGTKASFLSPVADFECANENADFLKYSKQNFMNIYTRKSTNDDMQIDNEINECPRNRQELIQHIIENQFFLYEFSKSIKNSDLIVSLCQLCHLSGELAHQIWIQLFIQMFNLLNPKQQQNLYGELTPFIASGSHCIQKQLQMSTINTFLESFALAKPMPLFLRPSLLAYIAKNHNIWHRAILLLENSLLSSIELTSNNTSNGTFSSEALTTIDQSFHVNQQQQLQQNALQNVQHETFSSLSQLYSLLKEDDYRAGLIWSKRELHDNTKIAIMYEQQGLFYQAQKLYEEIISRKVDVYLNEPNSSNQDELLEFNLWEERWIRCSKELNQWSELSEYASTKENDISLNLECAWKSQQANEWQQMKALLNQKDTNLPKEQSWRLPLYQGYYIVCNPEDCHNLLMATNHLTNSMSSLQAVFSSNSVIEPLVERCMLLALKEWRRLPRLVSPAHMSLLQAAQQIVELQEAFQIQNNLYILAQLSQSNNSTVPNANANLNPLNYLQEIKGIIKTWRTRLPLINDDLSYWNDIFTWRQYHYESFTRFYEKQQQIGTGGANPAMLGVHALAQGIVHFGKIARKQHLYDLCLDTLNKIHKKQSVPIVDCFLKVKQEIKCYINTFEYLNAKQSQELLDVIEATNLKYFTKENVAELISLKAHFLLLCGKYDDANHLYSFSIYLNDSQAKLWGAWGDYLTQAYVDVCSRSQQQQQQQTTDNAFTMRSIETAESSLIALLHAARHSNSECKARKYISKILWLLTYDNENRQLCSTFESYAQTIQASHWINWIPQLITLLMRNDDTGRYMIIIMNQIVKMYPFALYYPLRTVYLKLKNDDNTEKQKKLLIQQQQKQQEIDMKNQNNGTNQNSIANEALIRVTQLMHRQREMHPTLFNTLEGLIDQLLLLNVTWYEESLRNFKQTLIHSYIHVYDYMKNQNLTSSLQECLIDPLSISWFKKLNKFYLDLPTLTNALGNNRLRKIQAIVNDSNYQIIRQKFQIDFNYQIPSQFVNVFTFINKIKNWINLFELHIQSLPKQQLLDDRFKFVTQFCSSTAEIEIPGEFLIPRSTNYCVRISRFLPRYESVEKFNSYMRRISIRGHNGKVYSFLIANEERTFYEGRKEEHVMQLMRMLNSYLSKQKETASRNLFFTLPRIVSLSVDVRMIEDDCSAISLLDIYKNRNRKLSNLMAQQQKQNVNKSTNNINMSAKSHQDSQQKLLEFSEAGDLPITRFFEKLQSSSNINLSNETKINLQNNKHIFLETFEHISTTLVPKNILKDWAMFTYSDATDYFHFRKMFTSQLAIYSLAEYAFQLTRLNPDQFYMSQNSGICQAIRLKFDLNEQNTNGVVQLNQLINNFNADRPVPFRLTPNITEFITSAGVNGPLNTIIIALARCLIQPQYHFVWLVRAILKDEILMCLNRKKNEERLKNQSLVPITQTYAQSEIEAESLINLVNKLVGSIESRLKECAALEGGKNFVTNELIPKSINIENLSQMDPLWYPWF